MSGFNFADSYKAAGLTPGPEIIGLRQAPFDKLLKQMETQMIVDITRLYFGLPVPRGTEWFREAFAETDPSFSMLDNAREAAVLSACLLSAAINNGETTAALTVLTTSASGNRDPLVLPELIETARLAQINIAVNERHNQATTFSQFKIPPATNLQEAVDALIATPGWPAAGELITQANKESIIATKSLASQVQKNLIPLVNQVADLREEVAMLWWHIGGWSRVLNKPFVDLNAGLAATMAGLDLADLSRTPAGPAAASAILHRTVLAIRDVDTTRASIKEVAESIPTDAFANLNLGDKLVSNSDVCPVLTGILKAQETGGGPGWENAFRNTAQFDETVNFDLTELAVQVYRERSLLTAMD